MAYVAHSNGFKVRLCIFMRLYSLVENLYSYFPLKMSQASLDMIIFSWSAIMTIRKLRASSELIIALDFEAINYICLQESEFIIAKSFFSIQLHMLAVFSHNHAPGT